jgi:hypothetical protein
VKTSEVLIGAKLRLWDGETDRPTDKYGPICYAISSAYCGTVKSEKGQAHLRVRKMIMYRLYPACVMGDWLADHGISRKDITSQALQAHRHAWVDQLIVEFQANGD